MPVRNLGTTMESLYPPQPKSLRPRYGDRDTVIQSRGGSLFGCFSDWYTCCLGYFCPCALFGRTLKRSGLSSFSCFGFAIFVFIAVLWISGLYAGMFHFGRQLEACVQWNVIQKQTAPCRAQLTDPLAEYCTDPDGGALPGGGCPVGQQCTGVVTGQDAVVVCAPSPPPACTADDFQHWMRWLELATTRARDGSTTRATVAEVQSEAALVGASCIACVERHLDDPIGQSDGMEECHAVLSMHGMAACFAVLAFWIVSGIVFGYYREGVKTMLVGGSCGSQLTLSSFLLHCCPLTSACAFCQEARAVDNDISSYV